MKKQINHYCKQEKGRENAHAQNEQRSKVENKF